MIKNVRTCVMNVEHSRHPVTRNLFFEKKKNIGLRHCRNADEDNDDEKATVVHLSVY